MLTALAMLIPDAAQAQQGPFVYVPNLNSGDITVIDTPTNTVMDTSTNTVAATIPVGNSPTLIALSPDNTRAYVANQGSASVSVTATMFL